MQRAEHILMVLQVIVAGLAVGVVAGLALQVVIADPALLAGAAPAFAAGEPPEASRGGIGDAVSPGEAVAAGGAEAADLARDPAHMLPEYVRDRYHYAALGRRDPFQALIGGELETDGDVGLPDAADLRLVGIAWDAADRFAMAEDSRGFGYVLRVGDAVRGGKVARIQRDSVTFAQYTAGELSTITLELPLQEDSR